MERKFKIGDIVTVIRNGCQYNTSHRPVDGSDDAMEALISFPNQIINKTNYTTHKGEVVDAYVNTEELRNGVKAVIVAYDTRRGSGSNVYVIQVGENGYAMGEDGIVLTGSTMDKLLALKNRIQDAEPAEGWKLNPPLKQGLDYVNDLLWNLKDKQQDKVSPNDIKQLNNINRMVNDN